MSAKPDILTPGPGGRVIVARYGRDLEDFTVGDVYEHRPGRTITAANHIRHLIFPEPPSPIPALG